MNDIKTLPDEALLHIQRKLLLIRWGSAVGTLGLPLGLFWFTKQVSVGLGFSALLAGMTLLIMALICVKLTQKLKILEAEVLLRGL